MFVDVPYSENRPPVIVKVLDEFVRDIEAAEGMEVMKTIKLGFTRLRTAEAVGEVKDQLVIANGYVENTFDLTHHNSAHFAEDFSNALISSRGRRVEVFPSWVNRVQLTHRAMHLFELNGEDGDPKGSHSVSLQKYTAGDGEGGEAQEDDVESEFFTVCIDERFEVQWDSGLGYLELVESGNRDRLFKYSDYKGHLPGGFPYAEIPEMAGWVYNEINNSTIQNKNKCFSRKFVAVLINAPEVED